MKLRPILFSLSLIILSSTSLKAEATDPVSAADTLTATATDIINPDQKETAQSKSGSWRVDSIRWHGEFTASLSGGKNTPFWLLNNTQGLGSIKRNNLRLRAAAFKDMDRSNRFSWGAGIDLVGGYRLQSPFAIHQLYGELRYRCLDLMIGQKEMWGEISNPRLSTGNLLYSGNSRPIPQIRAGIFDYADVWGTKGWLGIKGYLAFGMMTDSKWLEEWTKPIGDDSHALFPQNVKYHSKGIWLRNGNANKFPLTLEVGLEMATQFGGGGWFKDATGKITWVEGSHGLKGLWHAFVPQSGGSINSEYYNVEGNFLGNWSFCLAWTPADKDWSVRAYYQHMFEDHSMLYIEYPWRDGLWGVEGKLPRNPFVSRIVYEFLYMKDQTGPVYWDKTDYLPTQVSGRDEYYNHMIYGAWQHWGMIIGNPMILSPLYNDGALMTRSSRIIGHHLGFEGQPTPTLSYRVLASYQRSWGTYKHPFPEVANSFNLLAEVSWRPQRLFGYRGWEGKASFGLDAGDLIGRSIGLQLSIIKRGCFKF